MFDISAAERTRVLSDIANVRAEIRQEVLDIFKGFVIVAYDSIVDKTPQWTGHATAQWNIGVGHLDMSKNNRFLAENMAVSDAIRSKSGLEELAPAKQRGDPAAVAEAKRGQAGKIRQITLDKVIYISNNVEAALRGSYASKLEENPNNYLRRENDGGHMILKTMEWFNTRLATVDIVAQHSLRMVKLSGSGIMETL